jgi:hypothetical protein
MTVVYNINPTAVSELWTTQNRTFHGFSDGGDDILLMKNDVALSARNAAYKVNRAVPRPYGVTVMPKSSKSPQSVTKALGVQLHAGAA